MALLKKSLRACFPFKRTLILFQILIYCKFFMPKRANDFTIPPRPLPIYLPKLFLSPQNSLESHDLVVKQTSSQLVLSVLLTTATCHYPRWRPDCFYAFDPLKRLPKASVIFEDKIQSITQKRFCPHLFYSLHSHLIKLLTLFRS